MNIPMGFPRGYGEKPMEIPIEYLCIGKAGEEFIRNTTHLNKCIVQICKNTSKARFPLAELTARVDG